MPRVRSPLTAPRRAEAFAVEDDAAQLVWRGLGAGRVSVSVADRTHTVDTEIDAGTLDLVNLEPDTAYRAQVVGPRRTQLIRFSTLPRLQGPPLSKIATISDLHLGGEHFGLLGMMTEAHGDAEPHALRCARAAIVEAEAWGAQFLIIKGDITHRTRPHHWERFGSLLRSVSIPYAFIVGNHDMEPKRGSIPASVGLESLGLQRVRFQVHDVPGVRIVLADGALHAKKAGRLQELPGRILEAATETDKPLLLALHFHLHRSTIPWFWPFGFPKPEGDVLLDALSANKRRSFITTGHSHRNRLYRHAELPITEVGSTKDYPGVWAGYVVHENGIRQVVRRVAEPSCLEWTERTRRAVGGIWGLWSPGTLEQRSFVHRWPERDTP